MSEREQYRYVAQTRANQAHAQKKKKKHRAGKVLLILLLVIVVVGGAAVGTWRYLAHRFNTTYIHQDQAGNLVDTIESTPAEFSGDWVNILVAGVSNDPNDMDYPDEYNGVGMTDIIMYVSYDVKNNEMSVLQIPRDSYVGDVSSTGKINAVYGTGPYKDDPISNLAEIIQQQYCLPIDYYVTVDIKAFTEIVDLMGGIDMYVPYDIWDENGNTVEKGTHHIDGATARWIMRQRHCYAQADIQRMETQQYFYAACFRLFKTCSVGDLTRHVLPVVAYRVNTDMDFDTLTSLAMSLMHIDSSHIYMAKVLGGSANVNGQSVFAVNPERTAEVLNEHFRPYGDPVPAEELGLPRNVAAASEIEDTGKYLINIIVE